MSRQTAKIERNLKKLPPEGVAAERKCGILGCEVDKMALNCEECVYYDFDEEVDAGFAEPSILDEDEMERFLRGANDACPFYRRGDDYATARRQ